LYASRNIIRETKMRRMRWEGHVARMAGVRSARKIFVGRHEGKRPLGRPRPRWDGNMRMYLREIG